MQKSDLPLTQDLVLIGGGHTHALVLRKWGMQPLPGVRITLINPGPTAPYSGMLPGFVAGHYQRADLDIDLVRLARFAGARILLGSAQHIDPVTRQVHVSGYPPISYDACSVDIGITSNMPELPGFSEFAIPAKPLGAFATRWSSYLQGTGPAQVAMLGGGVAGAELTMAMAHALKTRGRAATITLIDNADALSAVGARARARILRQMQQLGVAIVQQAQVQQVLQDAVLLQDGRRIPSDFTTGTAGARAYDWIAQSGLRLTNGFIDVDAYLQSSDPRIFAVGDCANLTASPRPKAGVYAVRQAPILYENLCATLRGSGLQQYKAQKDYLKLVSLGDKSALAERFGFGFSGRLMWRWKDRIDQAFIHRFRNLPLMPSPDLPGVHADGVPAALGDKPMCGGCGSKVGRGALRGALAPLTVTPRSDITPLPGDDAALLLTGTARQVITSDHLRAMVDDPVAMTRIAAVHALGDIWAMGAKPQAATATIILPRLSAPLQERTLSEIMQTAAETMRAAGAEIVGGHSSVGTELTIGFTVTGLCERDPITLAGGQPGDALILTKPIGSGVLMAADMTGLAQGSWIAAALEQMMRPQSDAAQVLADAHAMTDVTGFGLAGHLLGMCEASGAGAELDLSLIPMMKGAQQMAEAGVQSSLFAENRALAPGLPQGGKADLLFDPQTAGGLLAAVETNRADAAIDALREQGYPAARIGRLTSNRGQLTLCAS